MTTPTKQPILSQSILTPSVNITPTRETAREDDLYDDFASTQNDCSEAPRDGNAPSSAPAVSVEPAYDGAEPSPSSPFTYDGDGARAEPAGGFDSFDPFPGIPAPTKPEEIHETAAAEPETAEDDASATRALSTLVGDDLGVGVLVGAAVYYFHDDDTDFQVPARAVHHAEQALVHLKLALDVARQLHLIS